MLVPLTMVSIELSSACCGLDADIKALCVNIIDQSIMLPAERMPAGVSINSDTAPLASL